MWIRRRHPKRLYILALAAVAFLVGISHHLRLTHLHLAPQIDVGDFQASGPSPNMIEFWKDLAIALSSAEPNASQIKPAHWLDRPQFDPLQATRQLEIDEIKISADDFNSLKKSHEEFLSSVRYLAPSLPFKRGSRGIVMTADSAYLGVAITSLLMLRRTGSKLPVQLFLDSATERGRQLCDQALARLNARCLNMDSFFPQPANSTAMNLEKYQFKVFSLLFSTFQDILYIDTDAFPIHKPDYLLQVEPFISHGLVTWPDFWLPTVSPLFYEIAGVKRPPVSPESRSTESGIMLYNKAKHAESLLLAVYYNLYGPKLYYPLHSQSAWGQGDKETFRLSATVLGNPVWHVQTPPEWMSSEDIHEGSGIRQVDPRQDWLRQLRVQQRAEPPQNGEDQGPEEENRKQPRWLFAHTNRVKIDARRLSRSVGEVLYQRKDDQYSRLWGSDSGPLISAAGYDLEKAMWEEIIKASCSRSFLEECEKIRDYYDSVFVS